MQIDKCQWLVIRDETEDLANATDGSKSRVGALSDEAEADWREK